MKLIGLILLLSIFVCCQDQGDEEKHIFYLHGKIIEDQGIERAVSEKFGKYEYLEIIKTLKETGATVHQETRTEQTDFEAFCKQISSQIDGLVKSGVKPENIGVIGASKGAVMAMYISNMNPNPVNYILLAANTKELEQYYNWNLHGRLLGIYERSDVLAGKDYTHWMNKSTNAIEFKQIELNTGLGHGFLYRPIAEWINPAKKWINK